MRDRPKLVKVRVGDVQGRRLPPDRVTALHVRRSLLRILGDNALCSMATVTVGRRAHINTAYFCYSAEWELYFLSHPGSRHCRNLAVNSSMAMAIFSSRQKWAGPDRGVQLTGTCRRIRGPQARRAERLYARRFPKYSRWKAFLKGGDEALEYRFYRFVPIRLKILDEKEFGGAAFVSAVLRRR